MIQFENVTKEYDNGQPIISNLNLTIQEGEFFVLIGPSGCGKTTTLKMMNRLIPHTAGTIKIHGQEIHTYHLNELRWNIGYVLQQIALFPNMTVEENITVVPEMQKWSKDKMANRVTELLNSVGLDAESYRHRKPQALSGGEQQRIGVIRALAANPDIILMDEPFSALDPISRKKLQQDVLRLQKEVKKTIVFVTHDIQEALYLGDRIAIMRQGKIEQLGTPKEICNQPKNDFVKEFLGSENLPVTAQPMVTLLIEQGYFDASEALRTAPQLYLGDSLNELIHLLAVHNQVAIYDKECYLGLITSKHYLSYLAKELEKEGSAHE
ncbi:ABC transporter ATP-binding protein [Isobaculum melis]|uniref:ABC-type quaternary amine transporter n=1 Tax=Isobaculum melis TaxID=142588 RepID=A0A1H9QT01_9LACT|nr:ABC transporter ATP-binding protein [Isobaculum melis]SER62969.1 osmoprotectant transport system ATP-binding protein [Isobaculum melis]